MHRFSNSISTFPLQAYGCDGVGLWLLKCAGAMESSAALWSELPFEILDQVLSFLPVPDLCRYRSVCKRWDELICSPKFGAVCASNASKRDASFIAMRYSCSARRHEGWCFLDLNAKRWYVFKEDDREIRRNLYHGLVEMDGGLVCQFLEPDIRTIIVYNPIARTHIELPVVPSNQWTSKFYPALTIVVDSISQSFKVFLFHCYDTEFLDPYMPLESILNDPLMRVYDSATNEWKNLTNPFPICSGKLKASSVMFQGYLYVYISRLSVREEYPLWRYNLVEDAWENLAVLIPDELPTSSELVATANRLFLVGWSTGRFDLNCSLDYDDGRPWSFQVSELKVLDMTREMLFDISKADIVGGFDLKTGMENPVSNIPRISVIGFGNSLLFMSKSTGILAVFDLITRSWDHDLPQNPLGYLPDERCLWVGKQMNLLLPSTLS